MEISFGALLVSALFFFTPVIIILILLFFDHRKKPGLAMKYTLGFIAFVTIGFLLLFNFYMEAVILAPIIIWVYFFAMFYNSQMRKKKLENKEDEILDDY